jgi:hypothetical protein
VRQLTFQALLSAKGFLDAAMTLYVRVPLRVPSDPRKAAAEALRQRAEHVIMVESEPMGGKCWKCTRCGWVDCYTAEDLTIYGEPSECGENYHESVVEVDLAEGWAALSDRAALHVRRVAMELGDAKVAAAQAERNLALARAGAKQ